VIGYIRAVCAWLTIFIFTILTSVSLFLWFPIAYLFDKNHHTLHAFGIAWAWCIRICNPWWKFNFYGKNNLSPDGQAAIYVANHQSQIDILVLFMLNMRFRWIAKASLFKIPFLGWAMSAVGYVPVVRGNRKSQEKCMILSANHVKNGTPMGFFPEGTRSTTGDLGVFKTGAFRLAKSTGVPVIPISIQGCGKLLPKHSIIPQKASVQVTVHPAISSKENDINTLIQKTRDAILSGL